MRSFLHFAVIAFLVLWGSAKSYAQDTASFFNEIRNYDLSTVLMADSFLAEDIEGGKEKRKRPEPLGFIGDNYQRFFIHMISVIQNPVKPYEYLVYGKTKVKETICTFQGTITIVQAGIYSSADIKGYRQGHAICDVILFEDKKQAGAGSIKGKLTTKFVIDADGQFRYDATNFQSDRFTNNQFTGIWTSYKTGTLKKCNWGDYRIPESGDLDIGAGEFSVNDKYVNNGWKDYMLIFTGTPTNAEARRREDFEWWK